MKTFKAWLESKNNDVQSLRQHYFDQVMRTLQATEDDLSKPLADLTAVKNPDPTQGEAQPPPHGVGALTKVQKLLGGLIQRMSNDRTDVDSSVRAKRAMDILNKQSTDGHIQPVLYLQDFLRELFGNDFHTEFIDNGEISKDNSPVPPPVGPPPEQQAPPAAPQNSAAPMDPNNPQQPPMPGQIPPQMPPKPPGGLRFA